MSAAEETRICPSCESPRPLSDYTNLHSAKRANKRCRTCVKGDRRVEKRKVTLFVIEDYPDGVVRPKTRGECVEGPRPCGFVSCKYNMLLRTVPNSSDKNNFDLSFLDRDPETWGDSCVLDLADAGPMNYRDISGQVGLSRQRVHDVERDAKLKIRGEPTSNGYSIRTKRLATASRSLSEHRSYDGPLMPMPPSDREDTLHIRQLDSDDEEYD